MAGKLEVSLFVLPLYTYIFMNFLVGAIFFYTKGGILRDLLSTLAQFVLCCTKTALV